MKKQILDLIKAGRVEQERVLSNELFDSESYSEQRRKQTLAKYKRESLEVMSDQLFDLVSEHELKTTASRKVTYSGYIVNEETLKQIEELLEQCTPSKQQDNSRAQQTQKP